MELTIRKLGNSAGCFVRCNYRLEAQLSCKEMNNLAMDEVDNYKCQCCLTITSIFPALKLNLTVSPSPGFL